MAALRTAIEQGGLADFAMGFAEQQSLGDIAAIG
jgi:hypothetical protein